MDEKKLCEFAELLKKAQNIAVLTGAGMSTESGIPDYRSTDGLYNTLTSEEVFDIYRFETHPQQFYQVIGPLYCSILEALPNPGHLALHELEDKFGKSVVVATQNIDGLHQKAGSLAVNEVHGTMKTLTCRKCGAALSSDGNLDKFRTGETLRCNCGGVFKPDITFYGENLPAEAFSKSVSAFANCDLALVLGTSLQVYPAALLPTYRPSDAPLVIVNKSMTPMDNEAILVFHEAIGLVLPAVLSKLETVPK